MFNRSTLTRFLVPRTVIAATFLVTSSLALGGTEVNTGYFGSVAIQGYDPVAYFTLGKATRGNEEHAYKWLGAEWHFATKENKQSFAASPIKYAPQYGGHCAVGVAYGEITKDIDPEAWIIVDGKLYLNYMKAANEAISNDEDGELRKTADANWAELRKEAAQ